MSVVILGWSCCRAGNSMCCRVVFDGMTLQVLLSILGKICLESGSSWKIIGVVVAMELERIRGCWLVLQVCR
jgi:hypothetical protein